MVKNIFSSMGLPQYMYSDKGQEFMSKSLIEMVTASRTTLDGIIEILKDSGIYLITLLSVNNNGVTLAVLLGDLP